jgi:hypothetical protein
MLKITIAIFVFWTASSIYAQTNASRSNHTSPATSADTDGTFLGSGRSYYDAFAFHASGSATTTKGTIAFKGNSLTISNAIDFVNGQGIAVYGAGPISSLTAPEKATASQIATVANLAPPNAGIHGITCSNGTATATTLGSHGFPNGAKVKIQGATFGQYNIAAIITLVNSYQFTFPVTCPGNAPAPSDGGTVTLSSGSRTFTYRIVAEDSNSGYSAGSWPVTINLAQTLSFRVKNHITWKPVPWATQYLVYGDKGLGGPLTCIGPAAAPPLGGATPSYDDYGSASLSCPLNAPINPPSAAMPGILITTITSGGGTTFLTLAASANNAVNSPMRVEHDDTAAVNACIAAAAGQSFVRFGGGGHCFLPLGTYNVQKLLLPTTTPDVGSAPMLIEFNGIIIPRQPIEIASVSNYKLLGGQGGQNPSFGSNNNASVGVIGLNPVIEITGPNTSTNILQQINIPLCPGDCIRIDGTSSGGPTDIFLTDVAANTQLGSPGSPLKVTTPAIGFGIFLERGVLSSGGPNAAFDIANYGNITTRQTNYSGQGIYVHESGNDLNNFKFEQAIYESGNSPFLTLDCSVGPGCISNVNINFAFPSDPVTGADAGLVRAIDGAGTVSNIRIDGASVGSEGYPAQQVLEGGPIAGYFVTCGTRTAGCTALNQLWNGFGNPAGVFQDNQGALFITGTNGAANPSVHIITNSSGGDAISVENPLNSKVFGVDKNGNATGHNIGVLASLTTTAAMSDNVVMIGVTSSSHCFLTSTNLSAAANITKTYVSAKTTNQITVAHAASSGMTYDISCTPN